MRVIVNGVEFECVKDLSIRIEADRSDGDNDRRDIKFEMVGWEMLPGQIRPMPRLILPAGRFIIGSPIVMGRPAASAKAPDADEPDGGYIGVPPELVETIEKIAADGKPEQPPRGGFF